MRKDTEDLLELVLGALMQVDADPLALVTTLKSSAPQARVMAVVRALLAADRSLADTFNGASQSRPDAVLARRLALTLAEHADDFEHARAPGYTLADLPI